MQVIEANKTFTFDLSPITSGSVMVSMDADKVNEGNEASNMIVFVYDVNAPENTLFEVVNVTDQSFEVNAKFNESGTLFFAGGLFEGALPEVHMVIEGTEFEYSGSVALEAHELVNFKIEGLNAEMPYGIFLVSQDALGNTSEVYSKSLETTYLNETKHHSIKVFPNPVSETVYVSCEQKIEQLKLIAIDGKSYSVSVDKISNGLFSIDLQNIDPGIYFITGSITGDSFNKKIIKQ